MRKLEELESHCHVLGQNTEKWDVAISIQCNIDLSEHTNIQKHTSESGISTSSSFSSPHTSSITINRYTDPTTRNNCTRHHKHHTESPKAVKLVPYGSFHSFSNVIDSPPKAETLQTQQITRRRIRFKREELFRPGKREKISRRLRREEEVQRQEIARVFDAIVSVIKLIIIIFLFAVVIAVGRIK